jgi:hypothetical protein
MQVAKSNELPQNVADFYTTEEEMHSSASAEAMPPSAADQQPSSSTFKDGMTANSYVTGW